MIRPDLKDLINRHKPIERLNNNTDNNILLEYDLHKIDIIRAESYIVSPNWIENKKAAINPENEKDNKCFQWSTIAGLNDNTIKQKELKKILKFKRLDTDFSSHQRY